MTNEEKKAIEKLRNTSKQCHNSKECWENEDCTDCYVEVEDIMAIDAVLKLLKEQDNRIKKLEADNYECNNIINDYIGTVNIFNTMINLMLEEIVERKYIFGTIEQAEQYFENLAKESGEIDEDKSN